MQKVLFIIDSLRCGGAEKSLVSLLPLLDRDKYQLYLWVRHSRGAFESLVPSDVVRVSGRPVSGAKRILGSFLFSVALWLDKRFGKRHHSAEILWKVSPWTLQVPEGEFDIAVAYQQGIPTYLLAEKIRAKKKIAWVNADIFEVGYDIDFNRSFYRKMDYIVPVSYKLQDKMQERLPDLRNKLVCIYDVLNPSLIRRMSNEPIDGNYPTKRYTFTTVARMVPVKGYGLALDAAIILKERGLDFRWFFVGSGPSLSRVRDVIRKEGLSDSVFPVGMKVNPYPYIKASDLYVQTSLVEGFGMTVSEAKILNRPIVSTDFDAVFDQLEDGRNGIIVKKNGKALAEGIIRIIEDEDLIKRIKAALQAEENNTFLTEVKKVEEMFDAN